MAEYSWDDAPVKQARIRSAKEVIVVADASKFGEGAFAHVAPFDAVHALVADQAPPAGLQERLETFGVKVILADEVLR